MDKNDLLKRIADAGYNVGFGAKKHFATYDIVEKAPGWVGFISMTIGVFALFIDVFATKHISAILIVFGISALIINTYNESKQRYEDAGVLLTKMYNELKTLYYSVKSADKFDYSNELDNLKRIEEEFCNSCISKQILFSDWYAHYKFFWQHQIDWVDEQKHFSFWRDKVPLSFLLTTITLLIVAAFVFYKLVM